MSIRVWLWLVLIGPFLVPVAEGQAERAEYVVSECYGAIFNFDCGAGNKIRIDKDFFGYSTMAKKEKKCSYSKGECIISNPKSNSLIHRFCTGHRVCTYYLVERRGCGGSFSNYQQVEYQCIPESIVTDVCSTVNYKATSTYIASPGFPENYPPRLNCRCLVTASTPKAKVRLEIVYLAIKYTSPCRDWLSIGMRRTCGTTMDLFQGRRIPIEFHSDGAESHSGFWLHFKSSIPGDEIHVQCGNITFRPPRRPNINRRPISGSEGGQGIERRPRPEDIPEERVGITRPSDTIFNVSTTTAAPRPLANPGGKGPRAKGEKGRPGTVNDRSNEVGEDHSNTNISTQSRPVTPEVSRDSKGSPQNPGPFSPSNNSSSDTSEGIRPVSSHNASHPEGPGGSGSSATGSGDGTHGRSRDNDTETDVSLGISTTQKYQGIGGGVGEGSPPVQMTDWKINSTNKSRHNENEVSEGNPRLTKDSEIINSNGSSYPGDPDVTETTITNSTGLTTTVRIGAANEDSDAFLKLGLIIMCICIALGVLLVLAAIIGVYCRRHRTRDEETQTPNKLKSTSDGDSGQGLLVAGRTKMDDVYAVPHKADKSLQIDLDSDEYDDIVVCAAHMSTIGEAGEYDEDDQSFYSAPYSDSNSKGVQVSFNSLAKARFRDKKRKRNKTLIGKGSLSSPDAEPCTSVETTECSSSDSCPPNFQPISDSEPGSISGQEMDMERKRSLASMSQYSEVTMMPENAVLTSDNDYYDSFSDPDWDQKSAISI